MKKKWILYKDDELLVKKFSNELNIDELTAKILCHRGITTVEDAELFLNPETKQKFYDPFIMKDMNKAVERIIRAIYKHERIIVYGDYDVDGMTSSAIMIRALKKFGASVDFYIPDRQNEGYGFNIRALEQIADEGAKLLISVDCGISNVREIESIKNRLDVIVTDHHLPSDPIDNAVAVIDPHQPNCEYPFKDLCGAGVAFKLCQALNQKIKGINIQDYVDDIDLVALATVADIVPISGENRKIVRLGLLEMAHTKNLGLRNLIEIANIRSDKISAGQVGFKIAPRLNATGRLDTASRGVQLLITEDETKAKRIANALNEENEIRKEKEAKMLQMANKKYIELRKIKGGDLSSIIIASEDWHAGIIGLTASKIVEKHHLPTIVISIDGDMSRGSCRSINSLHMKDALDRFKHYFSQYGGHAVAAGFSMPTKYINSFRDDFDNYVKDKLNDTGFVQKQSVDAIINPADLTLKVVDEIENLEPFGIGNPQPIFACKNVQGINSRAIGGNGAHLSFYIKSHDPNENDIKVVAWNKGSLTSLVDNELIDITFKPETNEFNGNVSIECHINSIEPSNVNGVFPNREIMANIYKFLRSQFTEDRLMTFDICKLNADFKRSQYANNNAKANSIYTMLCAINVFEELGLIYFDYDNTKFFMPKTKKKFDLNESRFLRINNL